MSDNLEQMLMWCNRARLILSATSTEKQQAVVEFDKELGRVRAKLNLLIEIAGESSPVVQGFLTELDRIAIEASGLRDVSDPKYKGKEGQKTLREAAKRVTSSLKSLGDKISKSEPAKEIRQEREPFFKGTTEARKKLRELGTQELANATLIESELGFIEFAEQQVRSNDMYLKPGACKRLLQTIDGRVKKLALSVKSSQTLDLNQSKAKPQVEEQVWAAQRLLDEGETTGRLTPEIKEKLETTLKKIEAQCNQDQWTAALQSCKELPTSEQCSKAFLSKNSALKKALPKELSLCEGALEELADLLDASSLDQERSAYNELIASGGAGKLDETAITQANKKILKLTNGWTTRKNLLVQQKQALELTISDLAKRIERRRELLGASQRDQNARQYEAVVGLRDQRYFDKAISLAGSLSRQLDAQRPVMEEGRAWRKLEGGAAQLASDLLEQAGVPNVSPELLVEAKRLAALLQPASIQRLTEVRDWKGLLLVHQQAKTFLAGLPKRIEKYEGFNERRTELDKEMTVEWGKIEQALQNVGDAARKAGADPDLLLKPHRSEFDQLKREWKEWLDNASRESKSAIKGGKAAIADLLLRINGLNDPQALASAKAEQADAEGKKRFDQARNAFVSTELRALLEVDALKGAEFKKKLETLAANETLDDPGQPWGKRIEEVGKLALEAVQAANEAKLQLKRGNMALAKSVQERKLELQGLREAMKKDGIAVEKFAEMFKTLEADIANLELLATTGNMAAAKVNDRLLLELSARIRNLKLLATNTSTFKDYSSWIERHQQSIDDLNKDGLNNVAEETATALKEQFETLQSEIFGMEPGAAHKANQALTQSIVDARTQLQTIRDQQDQAVVAASDCLRRISVFAQKGFADVYRKSLEARVAAARQRAQTASELPAALRDFEAIKSELTEIETNPDAALKRQKNLLAEQHANDKLKNEWKSRLSVVEGSVMQRLKLALGDDKKNDQKAEVERIISMAKKAVKKSKDYERGLRLLTQAEGRVAEIERNPEGTALGQRKALPKHVEGYTTNVIKLQQALEDFVKAALEKVTNPQRRVTLQKALEQQVDPLSLQLNPYVFKVPLKNLTDDEVPVTKRREAREQALSRLRETMNFISKNPTMVKLANNPILPLMPDLRALDASLTRLEAHFRASVR